jgi:hypothetical protein
MDRATGKRKTTTGGKTREGAEAKARALSGEFVEGWKHGDHPPTVQEAVDLWLAANRSEWSSRTYDAYYYFAKKLTDLYADRLITRISPVDMSKLDLSQHSRGQQEKARTLVRGIFRHSSGWISSERASQLASGIVLSGTSAGKRNPRVERGDIPSSPLVAALIITAHHTLQVGPLDDPERTSIDQTTGAKTRHAAGNAGMRTGSARLARGMGKPDPDGQQFRDGLPQEITDRHRRGIPKHYANPEQRRSNETSELATRYRQIGLATALGAGGGLRIGELLALRVRHFLDTDEIVHAFATMWDRTRSGYRGGLEVSEQASQASRGKIWVTGTKGAAKSRTVHLPAFLPSWNGFSVGTHQQQIAGVAPRLADPSVSLWEATDDEAVQLWRHGFTPLGYLLWDRLWELWNDPAISRLSIPRRAAECRELLLFPTRNRARPSRDGEPSVQTDPSWRSSVRIVEGTGSYQAQSNWAKLTNPVYDFVAEEFAEWPKHRTNVTTRNGWTHHGLRHWAVSSRLQAGVALPVIAREMGHSDSSFTLERYGHVLDLGIGPRGFEY